MKKNLYAGLIITLISCGSNGDRVSTKDYTEQVFEYFKKEPQLFNFFQDSSTVINGEKGTEVSIPANCFVHNDGSYPTKNIDLELMEFYNIDDIVWGRLTTQTDNELLESAGMINIVAKSGGKELEIIEGKKIKVKFPRNGDLKQEMFLYSGKKIDNSVIWDETPISDTAQTVRIDTNLNMFGEDEKPTYDRVLLDYYLFESTQMNWLNCDKPLSSDEKTVLKLKVSEGIEPNLRIIFGNINAASLPIFESNKYVFNGIPLNETATILAFYKADEKYYLYKKELTITPDMVETAEFKEVSLDELKKSVKSIKWRVM